MIEIHSNVPKMAISRFGRLSLFAFGLLAYGPFMTEVLAAGAVSEGVCSKQFGSLTFHEKDGIPSALQSGELKNGDWVVAELKGRNGKPVQVAGQLHHFQLDPQSSLSVIADPQGVLYELDPSKLDRIGPIDPAQEKSLLKNKKATPLSKDREPFELRFEEIKNKICSMKVKYRDDPIFSKLEKVVEKRFNSERAAKYASGLACSEIAFVTGMAGVFGYYRRFMRDRDQSNALSEHGSNFFQGLAYMINMHCMLGGLSPIKNSAANQKRLLAATLGLNVAGNIWEEIELPDLINQRSLPFFNSSGQEVKTDLADFESGILSTLTYLVGLKALQHRTFGGQKLDCSALK
jgi:hypothetical protein